MDSFFAVKIVGRGNFWLTLHTPKNSSMFGRASPLFLAGQEMAPVKTDAKLTFLGWYCLQERFFTTLSNNEYAVKHNENQYF